MSHSVQLSDSSGNGVPQRATGKSFGYDLRVAEEVTIQPGEVRVVGTGLKLEADLPIGPVAGMALMILPRSSLPIKRKLMVANSPGLVDADYTGNIGIVLYNFGTEPVTLEYGERVAQAVFVRLELPQLITVVEDFTPPNRPERGGFGSTGTT